MKGPVLIVSSAVEVQEALAGGLGKLGFQSVLARSPAVAAELGPGPAPKLAVLDLDGIDPAPGPAIARLKARWPNMGVVALAEPQRGKSDLEVLAVVRETGAHAFFVKPISDAELAKRLLDLLQKGFGGNRRRMVLVVDDSATIGEILKAYLRKHGYDAVVKPDWETALSGWDTLGIDLVITDIFMPGMGGVEGIKYASQNWAGVPVVAMSGGLDTRMTPDDALLAARKIGADAALSKPLAEHQVVEVLKRLLPAA
ncbi:MAG: response regulator [Magnetospirillum sp.]|nr:response regulator [Magnetospirillum sp.]